MPRNNASNFRRSPIECYRNHIPCGDLSCKNSCDHNSLKCVGCSKNFHYKCNKVSEKAYQHIIDNNLDYFCDTVDRKCHACFLPFFEAENIVFLDTIIDHDGLYPCKKCKIECLDYCIQCDVCDVWLHAECANLKYAFECYVDVVDDENNIVNDSCEFICDDICRTSLLGLPFHVSKFSKNDKFSPFQAIYPCQICGIDCVNDCVQCNKCSAWVHFDCAELTPTDIEFYNVYENAFFCRERCKMAPLVCPPHLTKIRKSNNCVTVDNCSKEST